VILGGSEQPNSCLETGFCQPRRRATSEEALPCRRTEGKVTFKQLLAPRESGVKPTRGNRGRGRGLGFVAEKRIELGALAERLCLMCGVRGRAVIVRSPLLQPGPRN
jgi:hypothetical protein